MRLDISEVSFANYLWHGYSPQATIFSLVYNNKTYSSLTPFFYGHIEYIFDKNNISKNCGAVFDLVLFSSDSSIFLGHLNFYMDSLNNNGLVLHGVIIKNSEERISALESWKETIDEWKNSIVNMLQTGAGTWGNYIKYLSSSTKKKMVCGYAEENRLTHVEDLGWNCNLTYTILLTGKERITCRCSVL
ncbi:hypothetical protein HYW76_04620 [Candidatus Pacearchaeota archaeon]|nr:hypothetical protein [Candidatus Pacearchaeota archaeon]